jgi:heparan sulfate N-deacetylase/N-sulfotransferase NDST2
LLPGDVKALVDSQKRLQAMIPGFRYNLGFSGGVFKTGNYDEQVPETFCAT